MWPTYAAHNFGANIHAKSTKLKCGSTHRLPPSIPIITTLSQKTNMVIIYHPTDVEGRVDLGTELRSCSLSEGHILQWQTHCNKTWFLPQHWFKNTKFHASQTQDIVVTVLMNVWTANDNKVPYSWHNILSILVFQEEVYEVWHCQKWKMPENSTRDFLHVSRAIN